jgi:hypothetical protein
MTMTIRDVIYRFAVSGSSVSVVGKTRVKDAPIDADFAIQSGMAVGRASKVGNGQRNGRWLGLWAYPTGGKPVTVIKIARPGKKDIIGAALVSVGSSGSR